MLDVVQGLLVQKIDEVTVSSSGNPDELCGWIVRSETDVVCDVEC